MAYLADLWASKWENMKGHAQTKFWCLGPDPNPGSQTAEHV